MAYEYPLLPLGQIVNNCDARRVPLSGKEREQRQGCFPYYGANGIMDYIDNYLYEGLHLLIAEDGSVEMADGKPCLQLVNGKFWVSNHAHVLKGTTDEETKYIYYALSNTRIRPFMTGSVQAKLSQANMNRIPIPYPTRETTRQAIVHILGSLDDKIEVNRKLNLALEEMTKAVFKSWFLDFDPVRAKLEGRDTRLPKHIADLFPDSFEDSELGQVPKGWKIGVFEEAFDLVMGQSPPGESYNEIGIGQPFYQGRTDFTFRYPKHRVYCTAPTRFAKLGDTLVSVRAPVGDINMAGEDCAIGRGVAAVKHKSGSRSFTYYSMLSLKRTFDTFEAGGTVFGSINKNDFYKLALIIPEDRLIVQFERLCGPFDKTIENNESQSLTLAALRYALLPKLISGKLPLIDADRFVERSYG